MTAPAEKAAERRDEHHRREPGRHLLGQLQHLLGHFTDDVLEEPPPELRDTAV